MAQTGYDQAKERIQASQDYLKRVERHAWDLWIDSGMQVLGPFDVLDQVWDLITDLAIEESQLDQRHFEQIKHLYSGLMKVLNFEQRAIRRKLLEALVDWDNGYRNVGYYQVSGFTKGASDIENAFSMYLEGYPIDRAINGHVVDNLLKKLCLIAVGA